MATLDELFGSGRLREEIDAGNVRRGRSGDGLSIYNYTETCQYGHRWNEVTLRCRGLIAEDATGEILAWPFPKFFNYSEHGHGNPWAPDLPDEPFRIYDKVDGCFHTHTALNLWGGGTITIGQVVRKRLPVTLVGMDEQGNLVPAIVTDWHRNGRKDHWLDITVDAHASRTSGAGGHPNKLRVTVNHHIYVNGEYRAACEIKPGDEVATQDWRPSDSVLRLIRASLLGDGCVTPAAMNPASGKYQEPHTIKHHSYVEALRKALGDCAVARADTISGYGSAMTWAGSREYAALGELRREWYPNGAKRVPADLSWIDDFAVAKWYMDDGSMSHSEVQRDRMVFATNSFPEEDVRRLAARLTEMYGVSCSVFLSKGWVLRVNAGKDRSVDRQIDRMWAAMAPHVHPAMRYKLPECWRDVPYMEMEPGHEVAIPKAVKVLAVEPVEPTKANFPSGRIGYDVTTTTHNYMARGVLVHNSLAIVFWHGRWRVATRGSFSSVQAQWAREWLNRFDDFGHPVTGRLQPGLTYLAEIVYPENRIVVNHGNRKDLVLLGAYGPRGAEVPLDAVMLDWMSIGSLVRSWPQMPLGLLVEFAGRSADIHGTVRTGTDIEGYVLRYESGARVKIKLAEYIRMHAILTGMNERTVWEVLANGGSLDDLLTNVPDEFMRWVQDVADRLRQAHAEKVLAANIAYAAVLNKATRKEFAAEAVPTGLSSMLFRLYDGKSIDEMAWKMVKPSGTATFSSTEGE